VWEKLSCLSGVSNQTTQRTQVIGYWYRLWVIRTLGMLILLLEASPGFKSLITNTQ